VSVVLAVVTAAVYLPYFKDTFGLDTVNQLAGNRMDGVWEGQGRAGLAFAGRLVFPRYTMAANLLAPFLAMAVLVAAGVLLYSLVVKHVPGITTTAALVAVLTFINNPVTYSQLYFKLQAVQLAVGLLLVIAVGVCWLNASWKPVRVVLLSSVVLGGAFFIYQTLAFFAVSLALFWMVFVESRRKSLIAVSAASIALGTVLYELVNTIYTRSRGLRASSSMSYFGQFVSWNKLVTLQTNRARLSAVLLVCFLALALILATRAARASGLWSTKFWLVLFVCSIFFIAVAFGNFLLPPRVYFGTFNIVCAGIIVAFGQRTGTVWMRRAVRGSFAVASVLALSVFALSLRSNTVYGQDKAIRQQIEKGLNTAGITRDNAPQWTLLFCGSVSSANGGAVLKALDAVTTGNRSASLFAVGEQTGWAYNFLGLDGYHFATTRTTTACVKPDATSPVLVSANRQTSAVTVNLAVARPWGGAPRKGQSARRGRNRVGEPVARCCRLARRTRFGGPRRQARPPKSLPTRSAVAPGRSPTARW